MYIFVMYKKGEMPGGYLNIIIGYLLFLHILIFQLSVF